MAARYVNPTNVVAQGQGFYTGLGDRDQAKDMRGTGGAALSEGSYTSGGGGGGGNVMGRGSGGSAGVSADRTGSDSSKSWNYGPQMSIKMDVADRREGEQPDPTADPRGGTSNPTPGPTPSTGRPRRPQQPAQEGEPVDAPPFPQLGRRTIDAASWETPNAPQLPSGEQPALTGTTTPSLSGPVQPRQLVKEVPSSRRERINSQAQARRASDRQLINLGKSVREQHGDDTTAGDLMPSSDAMFGMRGATAGSRDMSRPGV